MNILYVAMDYFGNPDLVRLSVEMAQRNHRISVATFLRDIDKHCVARNVDVLGVTPLMTITNIGYRIAFPFARIYRIVEEQSIDVIHALGDYSANSALAAAVSRVTDVPFVYTIQGIDWRTGSLPADLLMEFYNKTIEQLIAKRASKVILLSKRLMPRAEEFGVEENKTVVVPSGVDCVYFNPERPEIKKRANRLREELGISERITVGCIGRLVPAKGLTYLMSALRQIHEVHNGIALVIVGDGPEKANLEAIAKDLEIKTIFTGWQTNTRPYYKLMDIFVLPSLYEGLPNVVLEAMAMGKPVIATDVGGNPDLIVNGRNGFLVPVRDSGHIAAALKKLVENGDLRRRMGLLGRQIAEEFFSWNKIVEKVETVYNEIIGYAHR